MFPLMTLTVARRDHAQEAGQGGNDTEGSVMRGVLLWAVGIPIPLIILLYLFHVI